MKKCPYCAAAIQNDTAVCPVCEQKLSSASRSEIGEVVREVGVSLFKKYLVAYIFVSVVCLLVIASIAIPNYLRSRVVANEAAAVGALRALNAALADYSERYDQFPSSLDALGPSSDGSTSASAAGLVGRTYLSHERDGYRFEYLSFDTDQNGRLDAYSLKVSPMRPGWSGGRYFFSDQTKVIRMESDKPANAASPPI